MKSYFPSLVPYFLNRKHGKRRQGSKTAKDTAPSRVPPSSGGEEEEVEKPFVPLTVYNMLPKKILIRKDFQTKCPELPWEHIELLQSHLDDLRAASNIPDHVEMAPTWMDYANVHRPGYCTFYEYPFLIDYSLPIYLLAEELCRFYNVCPTQLTPYTLKVCRILTTYAAKDECEVSVHHLLHLFNTGYLRGTMLQLKSRGTKGLLVKYDDKTKSGFWRRYFFIRTEHLVSNPAGFPEKWNSERKYLYLLNAWSYTTLTALTINMTSFFLFL